MDSVDTLVSLLECERDFAEKLLQKHGNNLAKAANAFYSGDMEDDEIPALEPPDQSVIDLTGDDEEDYSRGRKPRVATVATEGPQPNQLVRSDRAPDPSWQVVRSNARIIAFW
jgi:hypothetical protein